MYCKAKYLSYSWNKAIDKTKIKENKIYQKATDETSSFHVFGHALLSVLIVAIFASGLHTLEVGLKNERASDVYNNLFTIKVVEAAELKTKAKLFFQSHETINIKPGEAFTFNASFQNLSDTTWTNENVYLKSQTTALKFRHNFWPDPYLPAKLQETNVEPNNTGTFKFALQAPDKLGLYKGDFLLVNNNVLMRGGSISITMNVVADPSQFTNETPKLVVNEPATNTVSNQLNTESKPKKTSCTLNLHLAGLSDYIDNETCTSTFNLPSNGPNIRVGIVNSEDAVRIVNNKAWQIYDDNETLLASVPANLELMFNYLPSKGEYVFDFIDKTVRTKSNLKLKNFNDGIFTISSYNDIAKWNKSINFNQFRGDLEIAYYEPKKRTWVINTLPLEDYLKGIKETSNPDPAEYQKTMTVAARTYALYHVNKFKVEDSFFDVYNDERDQVYKGYIAETVMPNQAKIVEQTQGVILSHADQIIIAYYSARSGGKTTNSNNVPYLKSVTTPYSGSTLYGHGLGIDQIDAKARADKLNWTYEQILRYYYKDIDIEKIY